MVGMAFGVSLGECGIFFRHGPFLCTYEALFGQNGLSMVARGKVVWVGMFPVDRARENETYVFVPKPAEPVIVVTERPDDWAWMKRLPRRAR
jgi:hypothetical protein